MPGRLQHPPLRRVAATAGAAGTCGATGTRSAMSASSSSQRAYDGTRYCVGKIMLRKSSAVMRTHSCGEPRAHRVHRPEAREHEVDAGERRVDLVDARVGVVRRGLRRRAGLVDLPRERAPAWPGPARAGRRGSSCRCGPGRRSRSAARRRPRAISGCAASLRRRRAAGRSGSATISPATIAVAELVERGLVRRARRASRVEALAPARRRRSRCKPVASHASVDEPFARSSVSHASVGHLDDGRPAASRRRPRAGRSARTPCRTAGPRCRSSWRRPGSSCAMTMRYEPSGSSVVLARLRLTGRCT